MILPCYKLDLNIYRRDIGVWAQQPRVFADPKEVWVLEPMLGDFQLPTLAATKENNALFWPAYTHTHVQIDKN